MTPPSTVTTHPSGKVLACIDESRYAESVCDYAAWSAARMAAPLSLLHVIQTSAAASDEEKNLSGAIGFGARERLLEELAELDAQRARLEVEHGRHMLAAALERTAGLDLIDVETRQRHGGLVEALLALEAETRMFVVGKRGSDSESEHGELGGHLEAVLRAVHRPVLIAQQSFAPPQRILFAHDGSATAHKGVAMVADSPLFRGIPCHLVTAGGESEKRRAELDAAAEVLQNAGFAVETAVVEGDPEDALPAYQEANGIDLMIMGAWGHSRIRQFILGNTTTAMIRRCRISLMVLR